MRREERTSQADYSVGLEGDLDFTYSSKPNNFCVFDGGWNDSDDPDLHVEYELDDYYDSDEPAEERNRNDDLLKMIEGLWE